MTHKHAHSSESHFSSSPSPSTSTSLGHSASNDNNVPTWPSDFYAVNIVCCFKKCEAAHCNWASIEEAFLKCFKVPFWSTTFYNHCCHWEKASQACCDEALRGGHSPAGSWTAFLKRSCDEICGNDITGKRKRKMDKLNLKPWVNFIIYLSDYS